MDDNSPGQPHDGSPSQADQPTADPDDELSATILLTKEGVSDRRHTDRRSYHVGVYLETPTDSAERFGLSSNISPGGIFVVTDHPPPMGAGVELEFLLPNSEDTLVIGGRVRWLRQPPDPDASRPPGFGVEFGELSNPQREALDDLIATLDAPDSDPPGDPDEP